jgi:hypothetical protein
MLRLNMIIIRDECDISGMTRCLAHAVALWQGPRPSRLHLYGVHAVMQHVYQ